MAASSSPAQNIDEFVQLHDQYLRSLRSLQDGLGIQKRQRADSRTTIPESFTPPLRALSGPTFGTSTADSATATSGRGLGLRRTKGSTLEGSSPIPETGNIVTAVTTTPNPSDGTFHHHHHHDDDIAFIPLLDPAAAATAASISSSSATDVPGTVQRTLDPMHFTDEMLLSHLRNTDFSEEMTKLLDEVMRRRPDMDMAVPFRDFAAFERDGYVSSTFEVYEIDKSATATKLSADLEVEGAVKYAGVVPFEIQDGIVDAPTVWEAIRDVNSDGQAVGRITIVQEPTPLMLAALHLTMSPHFDMSELLAHLLTDAPNRGRTQAFMNRAFERPLSPVTAISPPSFDHLRQRSFFFVFKYYTAVGPGLEPAPWQRYDKRPLNKRLGDHIDITECSSVLALSLSGDPTKSLRMRPRRERAKEGFIFDTFGPWQLLSIQSFPDDEHTVRGDDFLGKTFINGPHAFLDLLVAEYRDATKRNLILHERITKLITPPTEFMFDHRLRDKLLFEDKHFTYIRRYFWAYNTLAVINNGLKAMMASYIDTFTDDFWDGIHATLWPHSAPDTPQAESYRERMSFLRRDLDKAVRDLGDVQKRNERTRKEIENLRDQLFSGSSIKESRRAVEQGDNIRILTMISMIFLPLTFVTSVFGITEFTIPADDWRFALTMVLVCVPFMLLIVLLQTNTFYKLVQKGAFGFSIIFRRHRHRLGGEPDIPEPQLTGRKRRLVTGDTREAKGWFSWWKSKTAGDDMVVELGRVERG